MTEILKRLSSPFKEFGFFAGFIYLIDSAFARVSSRLRLCFYELMVQPIPDKPVVPARMTKTLEIREIQRGDPELEAMPVPSETIQLRFNQHAICLGAFRKDKFIGYIWFCCGAYEEDEVRCTYQLTPSDAAVFDFDLYLFPENRLGLGFIGIWDGANKYLHDQGIRCTFSRITRFNPASKRAHEHLGCKRVGRAIFLKAWQTEFMLATIFPYLDCTFRESRRMRLKLRADILNPLKIDSDS